MSRNNKSGGFNKFLNFIGIVDDDNSQSAPAQSFNTGSGYGQPEAYTPSSRPRNDSRTSGYGAPRRSIPAQGGRSNPGSRRVFEDDSQYTPPRRSSRFADEGAQHYTAQPRQQRSRARFEEEDNGFAQERPSAPARSAAPQPARQSSGQTVTCTLYTLKDVNPVINALIHGDTIYMNLNSPNEEQRILDTLSGAAFALDAHFSKPDKNFPTYLLAPRAINITRIQEYDD